MDPTSLTKQHSMPSTWIKEGIAIFLSQWTKGGPACSYWKTKESGVHIAPNVVKSGRFKCLRGKRMPYNHSHKSAHKLYQKRTFSYLSFPQNSLILTHLD